jgi:hypothetical protein
MPQHKRRQPFRQRASRARHSPRIVQRCTAARPKLRRPGREARPALAGESPDRALRTSSGVRLILMPSVRRNQAAEHHRSGYLPCETRSFSGEGLKLPPEVFPYQQTWQDTVVDARQ